MNDVVESALRTCGSRDAHSREKITDYLEKLSSAGERDTSALAAYGLAYLKELHEGPARRYSGC